jgi:hypothetical protein
MNEARAAPCGGEAAKIRAGYEELMWPPLTYLRE